MKAFTSNKKIWDKIYKSGANLEYPSEVLVRSIFYFFKEKNKKLLDLGCGSGNNLMHLAKIGFECFGCDISKEAISMSSKKADINNVKVKLDIFEDHLPYKDDFFDILISWQTLYYNDQQSLNYMLNEISRVLKKNGKILITLVKKNDIIVKNSRKISKNTYIVNNSLSAQAGSVIFVPEDKMEIIKIFNKFNIKDLGYFESKILDTISSHWLIFAQKK